MGMDWQPLPPTGSIDLAYFEQAGVPAVLIRQAPDPYYRTAGDTIDKINISILEANGALATAAMYDWAKNPALRTK
jgi:hypothetical protein